MRNTFSLIYLFMIIFTCGFMRSLPILANGEIEAVIAAANQGEKALKAKCDSLCDKYKNANSLCLMADIKPKNECLEKHQYDSSKGTYVGGKTEPTENPEQHMIRQMKKTGIFAGAIARKLTSAMIDACKKVGDILGEMRPRMGRLKAFCDSLSK